MGAIRCLDSIEAEGKFSTMYRIVSMYVISVYNRAVPFDRCVDGLPRGATDHSMPLNPCPILSTGLKDSSLACYADKMDQASSCVC